MRSLTALLAAIALAGCVSVSQLDLASLDKTVHMDEVIADFGQPDARSRVGDGYLLQWQETRGPQVRHVAIMFDENGYFERVEHNAVVRAPL